MEWNTNLLAEEDNYGIYAIKCQFQFLYIGLYKYNWEQEKEIIENYITYPEGTSIRVFQKLTPEERLHSEVVSLFSTESIRLLHSNEQVLHYNTLIWIKQALISIYTPKYNTSTLHFNDAHIPLNYADNKESAGSRAVAKWLKQHGIPFVREYQYSDLKGNYTNLRFDFKIQDRPVVIEFQGQQHYKDVDIFPDSALTRKYDLIKREYCGEKGILLIEIPYNYKNLDIYLNQIMYVPFDTLD